MFHLWTALIFVSATWAANGVRINAVAPGNVHTAMTATMSTTAKMALNALPIPTKYGQECLMAPEEIAEVMVFLASDSARGVNGNIMTAIEKYVEAMENKDYAGLANLFSPNGIINDYCTNSAAQNEYHIYGREAISMFFRNKFGFRKYSILDGEVVNSTQAEFIANFGGYNIMAIATVREVTEDGLIKRLTVRPK